MNKIFLTLILLVFSTKVFAQAPTFKDAGEYMDYISKQLGGIQTETWDYVRMMAHNKSPRKIENQRKTLAQTIMNAKIQIQKTPGYKGNNVYKDSVLQYLKIEHIVINEEYAKIVDMQEVSEQSYDLMEAYMLAKEKANEKLEEAFTSLQNGQKEFANANNINLIQGEESKTQTKLREASVVNAYHKVVFLIFFKSFKQEQYVLDAMNKNDLASMEQNIDKLKSTTKEGLDKLKAVLPFKGDNSVVTACKEMITFFQDEAETKFPKLKDFYMKKDQFDKIKKAFDAKPQNKRTKEDIEAFNKGVNELNAASADFNKINQTLNQQRNSYLQKWNQATDKFTDKHVATGK